MKTCKEREKERKSGETTEEGDEEKIRVVRI